MTYRLFPTSDDISHAMQQMRGARIGILGDFCVDAYWAIDSRVQECSIETGKPVQHVSEQRYSPGGAGNVVVNLYALGVRQIEVFGVIGDDVFGRELVRLLNAHGATTRGLLVQSEQWHTPVYGKPLLDGVEQNRLDFGIFNELSTRTWEFLQGCLCEARTRVDFLIVNQQLPHGWCDELRAKWVQGQLRQDWSGRHLVDTRQFVHTFAGAALKLNQHETARLLQVDDADGAKTFSDDEALHMARQLAQLSDEVQFLTRGECGIVVCHNRQVDEVPGVSITGPTDTVGAGDAVTAALAASLAAGIEPFQAATLANLAASVTVQKLNQTGTATEPELVTAARKLAYVYHPTLANEPRHAVYIEGSDIEVAEQRTSVASYQFAVFDHDGTVSTLRHGWEAVMEPVMMHAIMGNQYASAETALFERIQQRVQQFIEQSTGIQTIAQMDALVEMVHEFGLVPPEQRLDAWGYKRVYNDALMAMVEERLCRLQRGELDTGDFIMKGAVAFLSALRDRGVTLFLVSGTDEVDTIREATLLGYADLFSGGIFGAKPGSRADTKEEIIRTVLESLNKTGAEADRSVMAPEAGQTSVHFLVFGDGPVEIRLGRRYGGHSLGIASTEERRFGLNTTKRRRLIRAGAHTIVPDFSQWQQLVAFLCDQNPTVGS